MKKLTILFLLLFLLTGCGTASKIIFEETGDFDNLISVSKKAQSLARERWASDAKLKLINIINTGEDDFLSIEAFFYSDIKKTKQGRPGLLKIYYNSDVKLVNQLYIDKKTYEGKSKENNKITGVLHQDESYLHMNANEFKPEDLSNSLLGIIKDYRLENDMTKKPITMAIIRNGVYESSHPLSGILMFKLGGNIFDARTGEKIE